MKYFILSLIITFILICSCQRLYMNFKGVSDNEKKIIEYFLKNPDKLRNKSFDSLNTSRWFNFDWKSNMFLTSNEEIIKILEEKFKCDYKIVSNKVSLVDTQDFSDTIDFFSKQFVEVYINDIWVEDLCSKK
jgi:hypothetical protein